VPLFLCPWENGDCSFVAAPTQDAAIQNLDEIDNAEGSQLTAISAPHGALLSLLRKASCSFTVSVR
jgi:hypothetical protein